MRYSLPEVLALAAGEGLSPEAAAIAAAVSGWAGSPVAGESGGNPTAIGDIALQTTKWGPSIGLWQIRSLNAEKGTGGTRDQTALFDPRHNAESMAAISAGGTNWQPWTVYNTGAYRANLAAARAGIAGRAPTSSGSPSIVAGGGRFADIAGIVGSAGFWRRTLIGAASVLLIAIGLLTIGRDLL